VLNGRVIVRWKACSHHSFIIPHPVTWLRGLTHCYWRSVVLCLLGRHFITLNTLIYSVCDCNAIVSARLSLHSTTLTKFGETTTCWLEQEATAWQPASQASSQAMRLHLMPLCLLLSCPDLPWFVLSWSDLTCVLTWHWPLTSWPLCSVLERRTGWTPGRCTSETRSPHREQRPTFPRGTPTTASSPPRWEPQPCYNHITTML
jgi:hypothetical protein